MASWPVHTTTALKRWSCQQIELPTVDAIKSIHVYDFDNTLFSSPLPNKALWTGPTVGQLQGSDVFVNGGWWHDANILAATGDGIEQEEPRAWAGWWNELIVELVQFSMQQKDNVTVLLTGRSEPKFADLIKRIVGSKKLEFDMVCLKPSVGPSNEQFSSTMSFKQALLRDLISTYREADELRIYEDRLPHVKGFREFFGEFNRTLLQQDSPVDRKPITAEVVHVSENNTTLDPVVEITEVQRMINSHNIAIKNGASGRAPRQINKSVLFTGYMIPSEVTEKLKQFANVPPNVPPSDVRYLADSILIAPRPLHKPALDRIGGLGKKLTWRVVGLAVFENRIWAARVEPVPATEQYVSENPTPTVVLAILRNSRPADASRIQNWQPVRPGQALEFETMVGEKAILRVDDERSRDKWGRQHSSKRPREDENVPSLRQPNGPRPNGNVTRGNSGNPTYRSRGNYHQRGASNRGRASAAGGYGRGGGPGGRGRGGRGGFGQYRSLDDVDGGYQRTGGYRDYDSRNGAGYEGAQDEGLYDAY